MSSRPSRVIFVGNIAYGVSEEQLIDIFREAGPVVSFRLMFDRETGKPKGFGFCEFQDVETAMCAVRNLNNYELNGRQLKINFADNEYTDRDADRSKRSHAQSHQSHQPQMQSHAAPQIKDLSSEITVTPSMESINTTLASMTSTQLLEVLTHFKNVIKSSPEQAKKILYANPQLSYALLQALLMMGLVDSNVIQKLIQNFTQQPTGVTAQAGPVKNVSGIEAIPEAQRALLYQIMQMTQEQIDALPADQQQQVLMIKSQISNQKI